MLRTLYDLHRVIRTLDRYSAGNSGDPVFVNVAGDGGEILKSIKTIRYDGANGAYIIVLTERQPVPPPPDVAKLAKYKGWDLRGTDWPKHVNFYGHFS